MMENVRYFNFEVRGYECVNTCLPLLKFSKQTQQLVSSAKLAMFLKWDVKIVQCEATSTRVTD